MDLRSPTPAAYNWHGNARTRRNVLIPEEASVEKLGLSVEEAAEVIGIGRSEIYERMARGEIESVKVGRRRIIPAEAAKRFLDGLLATARAQRDSAKNA